MGFFLFPGTPKGAFLFRTFERTGSLYGFLCLYIANGSRDGDAEIA
jgi:hypothetical protein